MDHHVVVCEGAQQQKDLNEAVTACRRIAIGGRSLCTSPEHRAARGRKRAAARKVDTPRPKTMAEMTVREDTAPDPRAAAHRLVDAIRARREGPRVVLSEATRDRLGRLGSRPAESVSDPVLLAKLRAAVTR